MKLNMKLLGILGYVCLVMAIVATAQDPVLDTAGQPLQSGVEYYVKPAITDNGGRFTVIDRNNSCRYYAGQENALGPEGFPLRFEPFAEEESMVIGESRDVKVTVVVYTTCITSTTWKLAERDPVTQRRLIGTGDDGSASNYFRINKQDEGIYNIQWCPTEVCPICKFDCSTTTVGALVENGKRLLALDGTGLPVVFERA